MVIFDSKFFGYVLSFWRTYQREKPYVVVAVSGGADSVLLWEFALWLHQKGEIAGVRAVGVHHHTRYGQDEEMSAMEKRAIELGRSWSTLHRRGDTLKKYSEHELRLARLALLLADLGPAEELWMGHHLNDSWEWAQLQQARSSEVISGLGIPLKNGRIWRPFLCVSKEQILAELRRRSILWYEDPSNQQSGYARFLFRHAWQERLRAEHPQFLKHYARRSQRLAERLGVALGKSAKARCHSHANAILLENVTREEEIVGAVKQLSHAKRGVLSREVKKILLAQRNNKRGPFSLSGGVKAIIYGPWILVYGAQFLPADAQPSSRQIYDKWTRDAFHKLVRSSLRQGQLNYAPFWVAFKPDQNHRNTLINQGTDPLWPKLTQSREICLMHSAKLLERWKDTQLELWLAPLWPLPGQRGQD